ncbi:MAG: LmbE-like protein [Armatimonadetes bacterium]|nr:LmbE-like protein [Armatimonadota bacterium]
MDVALIIPAYNEESRIGAVLRALEPLPSGWELIVVNDGSSDGTSQAAWDCVTARVVDLPTNQGKGAAMRAGALSTSAAVLCFLDADLRGLSLPHVHHLAEPVLSGAAEMTVGIFRGGRGATDLSHVVAPWVSGQRAIRREAFLSLPGLDASRQGIEYLLTRTAREQGWRVTTVPWSGVTHSMKEEKLGFFRGHLARWRMYREIIRTWAGGLGMAGHRNDAQSGHSLPAPHRK